MKTNPATNAQPLREPVAALQELEAATTVNNTLVELIVAYMDNNWSVANEGEFKSGLVYLTCDATDRLRAAVEGMRKAMREQPAVPQP